MSYLWEVKNGILMPVLYEQVTQSLLSLVFHPFQIPTHHPPYNRQNPLNMTNVFYCCSLRNSRENKLSALENLQNCVTPLGNSKVKHETSGNSAWVFLEYSWKLHFFCNWPLELPYALSSIPLEIPCPSLNFFWDIPFPSILT